MYLWAAADVELLLLLFLLWWWFESASSACAPLSTTKWVFSVRRKYQILKISHLFGSLVSFCQCSAVFTNSNPAQYPGGHKINYLTLLCCRSSGGNRLPLSHLSVQCYCNWPILNFKFSGTIHLLSSALWFATNENLPRSFLGFAARIERNQLNMVALIRGMWMVGTPLVCDDVRCTFTARHIHKDIVSLPFEYSFNFDPVAGIWQKEYKTQNDCI